MEHTVRALYDMVADVLKFRSNHVTSLLFPSPPELTLHSSTAYKVLPIWSLPNSVVTIPFSCQNNYTLALSHELQFPSTSHSVTLCYLCISFQYQRHALLTNSYSNLKFQVKVTSSGKCSMISPNIITPSSMPVILKLWCILFVNF